MRASRFYRMSKFRRVGAVAAVLVLVACGSEVSPPAPTSTSPSPTSPSPTSPTSGSARVISGRLVPAGDVGAMTRVRVTLRSGARDFSGLANSDGTFQFNADIPIATADSVDLIVDVDDGPRPFAPIHKRIASDDSASYRRPLLISSNVHIPSGTYAGSTVAITLDGAFAPICPDAASLSCRGFFDYWTDVPLLWPTEAFPIPLAFFRREGAPDITPEDSAIFWANVASLEGELARDLFRPVDIGALGLVTPSGVPERGVAVSIDAAASPALGGPAANNGRLVLARVRANNNVWLRQRAVMNHELIHVLGFGHTCAWDSLMCGVSLAKTSATRGDVAAFLLAYLIDDAVRTQAPTTTVRDYHF